MTDDDVDRVAGPPAPDSEQPYPPPDPEPSSIRAYEPLETDALIESGCGNDG
jgi:hypothetical protein